MATEKNGWIKLHRKMLDNPIIMKDADHLAVWMYLLLNATHAEYPALFKGEKVILKPGQLITGRKSIAEKLVISESKIRRILDSFESDQQIERQRSNQNTLISLINWDKYQIIDQSNNQQVTNGNVENRTLLHESGAKIDQQSDQRKNVRNADNMGFCGDFEAWSDQQNDQRPTNDRPTTDQRPTNDRPTTDHKQEYKEYKEG